MLCQVAHWLRLRTAGICTSQPRGLLHYKVLLAVDVNLHMQCLWGTARNKPLWEVPAMKLEHEPAFGSIPR